MRVAAIVVLAACGRFDFDPRPLDAALDAPADAGEPGLLVWLRMEDDPADGDLVDSAGGDHTASCAAGLTCGTGVAGRLGQAVLLDGTQQFYRILPDPALVTPTAFTVAVWVRLDKLAAQQTVATKRYIDVYNSWSLHTSSANDSWLFESANAMPAGVYDPIVLAELGVWTHLTISWDDATKRGYVNGARLLDMVRGNIAFDDSDLLVGADDDNGTRFAFLTGAIDDLRIYNRKLSDFEIQQLAAQ